MSEAVIVMLVAIAAAVLMLLILVRRRVPEEGLARWVRESYAASRHARSEGKGEGEPLVPDPYDEENESGHVADLLRFAEDGQAYHRPVDLRHVVPRRHR